MIYFKNTKLKGHARKLCKIIIKKILRITKFKKLKIKHKKCIITYYFLTLIVTGAKFVVG